jgi:hypothetical protein
MFILKSFYNNYFWFIMRKILQFVRHAKPVLLISLLQVSKIKLVEKEENQ